MNAIALNGAPMQGAVTALGAATAPHDVPLGTTAIASYQALSHGANVHNTAGINPSMYMPNFPEVIDVRAYYPDGMYSQNNALMLFHKEVRQVIARHALSIHVEREFKEATLRAHEMSPYEFLTKVVPEDFSGKMMKDILSLGFVSPEVAFEFCARTMRACSELGRTYYGLSVLGHQLSGALTMSNARVRGAVKMRKYAGTLAGELYDFNSLSEVQRMGGRAIHPFSANSKLEPTRKEFRTQIVRDSGVDSFVVARVFDDIVENGDLSGRYAIVELANEDYDVRFLGDSARRKSEELLFGLTPGEKVVAAGNYRLGDFNVFRQAPYGKYFEMLIDGDSDLSPTSWNMTRGTGDFPSAQVSGIDAAMKIIATKLDQVHERAVLAQGPDNVIRKLNF